MADSALTHPNPVCVAACGAFAAAIAAGIAGADPAEMARVALATAERAGADVVARTLHDAPENGEGGGPDNQGWVLVALRTAFHHLSTGIDVESALVRTVGAGDDTDTNAAITGALLGAAHGRAAIPVRWTMPVLTCRPDTGLDVARPRPEEYWPDDLVDLAEALLRR